MATPFNKNIQALRDREQLKQHELAAALDIDRLTVVRWENNEIYRPRSKEVINKLKETFSLTDDDLFSDEKGLYAKIHGLSNIIEAVPAPEDSWAYVIGNVAAGDPREAIEVTGEKHYVDPRIKARYPKGNFLKVAGDSMNKVLPEGSYAYFADAENYQWNSGDIVVVKVNGDDATVKRITTTNDIIILEPESTNPQWQRIIIDEINPDAPYFRVLGKVVWFDGEL